VILPGGRFGEEPEMLVNTGVEGINEMLFRKGHSAGKKFGKGCKMGIL